MYTWGGYFTYFIIYRPCTLLLVQNTDLKFITLSKSECRSNKQKLNPNLKQRRFLL